jgi:glutamate dehydrogenase/leucine dehydrogenase
MPGPGNRCNYDGYFAPTYGRILAEARGIVAQALVTGKALRVGGALTRSEVNTGVDAAAAAEEAAENVCQKNE